jgi:hypothetical protein
VALAIRIAISAVIGCRETGGDQVDVGGLDDKIKQAVERVAHAFKATREMRALDSAGSPNVEDCCKKAKPLKPLQPTVRIVTPSGLVVYPATGDDQDPSKLQQ